MSLALLVLQSSVIRTGFVPPDGEFIFSELISNSTGHELTQLWPCL